MPSPRLQLPDVTLCAADTRTPLLALKALKRCMAQIDFAKVILFTDQIDDATQHEGIHIEFIPPFKTASDYSNFMLLGLLPWIETSHVLIAQWDGFATNHDAWRDEFLSVDYLGAPWGKAPNGFLVGNGGFSLRTKKLLNALTDARLNLHHPEDICICQTNRTFLEQEHGIRFGSLRLAQQFAFENEKVDIPTFGMHGLYNLCSALTPLEFQQYLALLPREVIRSRDAFKTVKKLVQKKQFDEALALLRIRRTQGVWGVREIWLSCFFLFIKFTKQERKNEKNIQNP
jgi:hypothetical protein